VNQIQRKAEQNKDEKNNKNKKEEEEQEQEETRKEEEEGKDESDLKEEEEEGRKKREDGKLTRSQWRIRWRWSPNRSSKTLKERQGRTEGKGREVKMNRERGKRRARQTEGRRRR
jgi:hypothetical protein